MKATANKTIVTTIETVTLTMTKREAEILGNLLGNIESHDFQTIVNENTRIGSALREPVEIKEVLNFGAYSEISNALREE
jgi:hypothetical protein